MQLGRGKDIKAMIEERWGIKPSAILIPEGEKYGDYPNDQKVCHPLLGVVTIREVKVAEIFGAIVWQHKAWKIASMPRDDKPEGVTLHPKWHQWRNLPDHKKKKLLAQQDTLDEAAKALGGQVVIDQVPW